MAAAGVEHVYRYAAESQAISGRDHARLLLQTSGGIAANPRLFDGWVTQGGPAAMALLVLGRVARTRFYTPPAMLARIIEAAHPLVTADGEQIRFEVFSPCNGVYARLDLTPSALEAAVVGGDWSVAPPEADGAAPGSPASTRAASRGQPAGSAG